LKVFIDTSFYVARLMPQDQAHAKAIKAVKSDIIPITSSLIVSETIALLQAHGFLSAAIEFLREARSSPYVQVVHIDSVVQSEAWDLFVRYGGMGANPVDCSSFAVMRRMGITKAFTFDRHFRAAGFETL
jgi:predicted nucleic acid-binding protein